MASIKDQIIRWGTSNLQGEGLQKTSVLSSPADEDVKHSEDLSMGVVQDGASEYDASSFMPKHSESFYDLKSQIHVKLLAEIDLKAVETLSSDSLKLQLTNIVQEIIIENAFPVNEQERLELVADLINDIVGLGPLEPLLADSTITEIMVNRYDTVFVERAGRIVRAPVRFIDDAHVIKVIDKIVSRVGRRIDELTPMADARLEDGSRVNAIIPPIAIDGPSLSIRRFSVIPLQMHDLIEKTR